MSTNHSGSNNAEISHTGLVHAISWRLRWSLFASWVLCTLGAIMLAYIPKLVGNVIGSFLISEEAAYSAIYSLIMANVVMTATWFVDDLIAAYRNPMYRKHLVDIVGSHVLYQNKRYFTDHNSGQIVTALMDAGYALPTMVETVSVVWVALGTIGIYIHLSYQSHLYIGIMMTCWCAAWIVVTYISTAKGIKHARFYAEKNLDMLSHTSNVLDNIMCVHAAATEEHEAKLLAIQSGKTRVAESIMEGVNAVGNTAQISTIVLVDAAFYLVTCSMVFVGDVQISDITQFGTIIAILFPLTRYVSRQVKYFIDSYGRYVAAIALLGQRVQKCAVPKLAALPDGHITIKDLTFTHCNLEDGLFKNISLQIKKGETVGFVGRSGSGKTTLVNLLMGHYSERYTGSIHIGEQDIKGLSVAQLRICIAHVPQQVTLFQRSVYDNIAYGSPGITRQQVITAAKQGCADVFVRKLPDGYDTVLNTKGVELSGGQKQRILLSRAMAQMNTANILIIDEGTSALDTETEKEVERAISSVLHETDKTCIVIAHRLSTLRQADRIVVFDNGRIVEMGAHDELLSNPDSAYKKLWNAQLV